MTRLFTFRFDVDTHRCVREGMPALSDLGRRLDAPFTFFVNMGRAVSRRAALGRALRGGEANPPDPARGTGGPEAGTVTASAPAAKLSARTKLGTIGYLHAAFFNPRVGTGAPDVIRRAVDEGHEVGLHGGTNHGTWQAEALGWNAARVGAEIDAVLPELERRLGATPAGFSSPGWSSPAGLPELLAARGFRYMADAHGGAGMHPGPTGSSSQTEGGAGVRSVRTALTGEPGGIAYLEHLRASGLSDASVTRRFEQDLERAGPIAVAYDHPYFAGIRELPMVARLVDIARSVGYDVVPLVAIADAGGS